MSSLNGASSEGHGKADRPFAITKLKLEDFRGFQSLEVEDWGGVNVLVGVNGSGKTAIIHALAICLSRFVAHMRDRKSTVLMRSGDVRVARRRARTEASLSAMGQSFTQGVTKRNPPGFAVSKTPGQVAPSFRDLARSYAESLEDGSISSVPIVAQYGVGRSVLEITPEPGNRVEYDALSAYEGAFRSERRFQAFFEWFRDREDLENQRKARGEEYEDDQLHAVRQAVGALMDGYSDLRIERLPLRMLVSKAGQSLDINQLSEGEKALLALIGDIARRLAIANPESQYPLEGCGIVLIDEIDLHLHPGWQRKVVQELPKVFPNVQFFLTTHSPIVASSAPQGSLYLLRDGKVERRPSFGQDVDLILEEVFNTPPRDEAIQREIDSLFEMIDSKNGPSANEQIAKLERDLGSSDPMLVRARVRMRGLGLE